MQHGYDDGKYQNNDYLTNLMLLLRMIDLSYWAIMVRVIFGTIFRGRQDVVDKMEHRHPEAKRIASQIKNQNKNSLN